MSETHRRRSSGYAYSLKGCSWNVWYRLNGPEPSLWRHSPTSNSHVNLTADESPMVLGKGKHIMSICHIPFGNHRKGKKEYKCRKKVLIYDEDFKIHELRTASTIHDTVSVMHVLHTETMCRGSQWAHEVTNYKINDPLQTHFNPLWNLETLRTHLVSQSALPIIMPVESPCATINKQVQHCTGSASSSYCFHGLCLRPRSYFPFVPKHLYLPVLHFYRLYPHQLADRRLQLYANRKRLTINAYKTEQWKWLNLYEVIL